MFCVMLVVKVVGMVVDTFIALTNCVKIAVIDGIDFVD